MRGKITCGARPTRSTFRASFPWPRASPLARARGVRRPNEQSAGERRHPGNVFAKHEQVDVVRAFVSFYALEVAHVPETLVLIENADAAQDVARGAGGIESDLDVVHFRHRDVVMLRCAGVF